MRWGTFMKIVVFVDHPKYCLDAIKTAAQIAKGIGASVTVLGIAPRYYDSEWAKSYEKGLKDEAGSMLENAKKIMEEMGVHPKVEILENITLLNVLDEIISFIKEGGFDLVVVGSSALTGLKKFFFRGIGRELGTAIINNAPCSVLVVRG